MKNITLAFISASIAASTAIAGNYPNLKHYTLTDADQIEKSVSAEDYKGAAVLDKYGEQIGTVYDLKIDPEEGEILSAYLAIGGFMGIGSEFVTVPLSVLKYDSKEGNFTVPVTKSDAQAHINMQKAKLSDNKNKHSDDSSFDERVSSMWMSVKKDLGLSEKEVADVSAHIKEGKIFLKGNVSKLELRKSVEEAFASKTDMKVINNIKYTPDA